MSSESSQNTSGTIIRGADGSLYFIRDEVLQACKVTEPEMQQFIDQLVNEHQGEVSGFSLSSGLVQQSIALQGPFSGGGVNPLGAVASTIMCPGSMKSGAFQVLPQQRF